MRSKVIILTPEANAKEFQNFVLDNVVPHARSKIAILSVKNDPDGTRDLREQASRRVLIDIDNSGSDSDSFLFVHRESQIDHETLKRGWRSSGRKEDRLKIVSTIRITKLAQKAIKDLGIYWRTHAESQIEGYLGKTIPLDAWLEQFNILGVGELGRRLAMQLTLLAPEQVRSAFSPKPIDGIGQQPLHCFVSDQDPAGSWVGLQDLLGHAHPPDAVKCIPWKPDEDFIELPNGGVDEVIIYEDGLWSGSETVKRLRAIKQVGTDHQIKLRFAVATDFGLHVVRHAIRSLELKPVVEIDVTTAQIQNYLAEDLPEQLKRGDGLSTDEYFLALHKHVVPISFRDTNDWPSGLDEAVQQCQAIGSQLAYNWLKRKSKDDVSQKLVDRFALGGGRFASTTFFGRSVPKVCLPLIWLDGAVKIGEQSVDWKPLLIDSRRVGDINLLYGL